MFFLILVTVSLIGALLHFFFDTRSRGARRLVELLLIYFTVIFLGFGQFIVALGHIVHSEQWAMYLGWPPGNPFQKEMGFASLGLATLGILAIWLRGSFVIAPVLGSSIFLAGSAAVHIHAVRYASTGAAATAKPALFTDLLVPAFILFLLLLHMLLNLKREAVPVKVSEEKKETET